MENTIVWINIASWLATATVLYTYARCNIKFFHLANAILFIPVALPAFINQSYQAVFISTFFGLAAIWRLYNERV
jgi:hypothetical protein